MKNTSSLGIVSKYATGGVSVQEETDLLPAQLLDIFALLFHIPLDLSQISWHFAKGFCLGSQGGFFGRPSGNCKEKKKCSISCLTLTRYRVKSNRKRPLDIPARIFSTALATTKFFSVVNPITGFSVRFGTPGLLGSNADLWKGFAAIKSGEAVSVCNICKKALTALFTKVLTKSEQ